MMQNSRADDLIEYRAQLARLRDRQLADLRLSRPYSRFSASVHPTLVALKSMPVTRARGQRSATFAACDVPQPATKMAGSSRSGRAGHSRWCSARRLWLSCQRRRYRSRLSTGGGYGRRS